MRAYLAHITINLKLTARDRLVLFFNYLFPLVFFFVFAQALRAGQGGAIKQVVGMVLMIGVLGNGFFGAGIRAVQEREANILRRFKVTPISPAPILVASLITGWIAYLPSVAVILGVANIGYGMPFPSRWLSLLALLSIGLIAFRAAGLIIASVVNSVQESQIVIQLFYLPMLFLSGATFPSSALPMPLQIVAQFLPATYLATGLQGILLRDETLGANRVAVAALVLAAALAFWISVKLFRWEKGEKVKASAKLWLAAVMAPFLILGVYQAYSRENVDRSQALYRELRRSQTLLIRDARIVIGDGRVIPSGAVLVSGGRIAEIYEGRAPDPRPLKADPVEGSGKTLLPGLIDFEVRLTKSGGVPGEAAPGDPIKTVARALAAYLYCGVTAVRSAGDPPEALQHARLGLGSGRWLGAQPYFHGSAGLPVVERAASVEEVREAIARRPAALEYAATGGRIPDEVFSAMARAGIAYSPALAAVEGLAAAAAGDASPLDRSLVQQVGPAALLERTRAALEPEPAIPSASMEDAMDNLRRAHAAGVMLVAGAGSGGPLVVHGPAIHRELQLWAKAGIPPGTALAAATGNAARLLGASAQFGTIARGLAANLLLVDGNPLEDIAATERISSVLFMGEMVSRSGLFEQQF